MGGKLFDGKDYLHRDGNTKRASKHSMTFTWSMVFLYQAQNCNSTPTTVGFYDDQNLNEQNALGDFEASLFSFSQL